MKLKAREELRAPSLADLSQLDDAAFRALFSKSPVKRIGRDRFVRNVLIAIGNSGDADLAPHATRLLDDESALVRGAAAWALAQLMPQDAFGDISRSRLARETDPAVREELTAAHSNPNHASHARPAAARPLDFWQPIQHGPRP